MPTVLVVDDSLTDRRLICDLLRRQSDWKIEQAASGVEALARIQQSKPDVLVTDLQMPEMDGLELLNAIRQRELDVPVILITAYGSEALAAEALRRGAASYVPKTQVAFKLLDTMEEVLARAKAGRIQQRLLQCLNRCEFTFLLENDPTLFDPLIDLVQQMVAAVHLCGFNGRLQIGVALKEALRNALYHGNLEIGSHLKVRPWDKLFQDKDYSFLNERRQQEPYCRRKIYVDVRITPEEARFVVRDEGPGFNVAAIPRPTDPWTTDWEGGRGLALMYSFMDEVRFNEKGNEVTMIKRKETWGTVKEGTIAAAGTG
ncbi:MAG: response regulator [Thermoguttaceae bacterium]|nr:response regulator [Thermoguttaceae bacterium]MDW8079843.1 response regulator [Thermoguttaceae bacterium]